MSGPSDFEKQAKDAVAAAIASDPVAGPARTVSVICQHLSHAARLNKQPKDAVVAVVRGSFNAILLAGQSLPDAAVGLMEALPNTTLMMSAGPEELMSWIMEGVADVTPVAGPEARDALRTRIEEKFMGASTIFDGFCEAAAKRA